MLYRMPTTGATAPAPLTLTGRNLAHADRTNGELALVGGDLHLERIALIAPTIKQCATLVGVCCPYVTAAVAIADDQDARDAVIRGDINIIDAAKRSAARESLADHIRRSTPAELADAAKATGLNHIWDSMLAPNLP
jgi:hypothetical protein